MSEIDKRDIIFAAQHACDYLALSFVNTKEDVLEAREIIEEARRTVDNIFDEINKMRKAAALAEARTDIAACGLTPMLHRKPDELSGGQRQRAALVRTFQTGKDLLLLDEPFGALDAITRLHLQQLLMRLCMEKGKTVLFVTHDVDEALLLSDEILVMGCSPGRIIAHHSLALEKPRTLASLALPAMVKLKADILDLLDQEVKRHDRD